MIGYHKSLELNSPVESVFKAITSGVMDWWTTGTGDASELNMVFTTRFDETYNHIKVSQLVPNERIEWDILEHYHANDSLHRWDEWTGTKIVWKLSQLDAHRTKHDFTHIGLVDSMECWDICEAGWNFFLQESLKPLVENGAGKPFEHQPSS